MVNHPNRRKPARYQVYAAALGKFTATTHGDNPSHRHRHYRVFDNRDEAQKWANEQNAAQGLK